MAQLVFEPHSRPKRLPASQLSHQNDEVILVAGEQEYSFKGESAEVLQQIFYYLDGVQVLHDIIHQTSTDEAVVIALLTYLRDESLVIDIQAPERVNLTGQDMIDMVRTEATFWRQHIHSQPCWRQLSATQLTSKQVLGWGIEFYHYVDAANEYMAAGVAYCRESIDMRQKLSRQYADEADHGVIFLQGLMADGFDQQHISAAPPLASTRALINYLTEVAMEGTLVYSAVFALMQSDGEKLNAEDLTQYYQGLASQYPQAKGLFEAFLKHALIDAQLDHQTSLFERFYRNDTPMSSKEVLSAINTIRTLAQYFILFYEQLFEYYGQENAQLPRRPSRVTDLLD